MAALTLRVTVVNALKDSVVHFPCLFGAADVTEEAGRGIAIADKMIQ